jgi:hypothetical protein
LTAATAAFAAFAAFAATAAIAAATAIAAALPLCCALLLLCCCSTALLLLCCCSAAVLTFDVPVQDFVLVHVVDAFKQLLHVAFNVLVSQFNARGVKQSRQVMIHVFEHHIHAIGLLSVFPRPVIPLGVALPLRLL